MMLSEPSLAQVTGCCLTFTTASTTSTSTTSSTTSTFSSTLSTHIVPSLL